MPTKKRKACFKLLVSSQNDIGWSHLLRGRFSHNWVQIQQDHADPEEEISSQKFPGQLWLEKVLTHLRTHHHMALKLCKADLHGTDMASHKVKHKTKLKQPAIACSSSQDCQKARLPRQGPL